MSQIDSHEFNYDNGTEIIEIEQLVDEQVEEAPPWKIKRLMCNIHGCTYQTDRRRDMRRHKRSTKHWEYDYCTDSDSDIDRPPYTCKLCDYTTAKKFCFVRHVRSVRHIRKVQAAEEEEELAKERGLPSKHSDEPVPAKPAEYISATVQDVGKFLLTCLPCDYSTTQRTHMARHHKSLQHLLNMQVEADESEFIEFAPLEEDQAVEGVVKEEETFEDNVPISLEFEGELDHNLAIEGGTFECKACEYKTARRFCFVRHVQSKKHLAKLQELEKIDPIVEANLGDLIEYAPAEETISEEVLYLPTDDDTGENAYYIIMSSDKNLTSI